MGQVLIFIATFFSSIDEGREVCFHARIQNVLSEGVQLGLFFCVVFLMRGGRHRVSLYKRAIIIPANETPLNGVSLAYQ